MQAHDVILAATDASGSGNLPFLIAVAAFILALIALVRVSSFKQEVRPPGPAASSQPAPAPSPAARVIPPTPSIPNAPDAIPPEIVAVIAAAVAAVTGNKPVRIVSIKPMSTSWERAGRQSVLTSHRIR